MGWFPPTPSLSSEEKKVFLKTDEGVAITITSVTDVLAFAVGSITILPGDNVIKLFCP
jgi:hypothetical protein